MTNRYSPSAIGHGARWEIESGYKTIKRFMAATTSTDFVLRFFYFGFACLLFSLWRSVNHLVLMEVFWRTLPDAGDDPTAYDEQLEDSISRARLNGEPVNVDIDRCSFSRE